MISFQMATYMLKRRSMSSQAVLFIFLVVCFGVEQCHAEAVSDITIPSNAPDSTTPAPPPTTTTKAPFNGNCTSKDNCSTGFCFEQKCTCDNPQYYNGSLCVDKIDFDYSCNDTYQCKSTPECIIEDDGNVCGCNDTHFSNDSVTCQQKIAFGSSCNSTYQCVNTTDCIGNEDSGVCGCNDTHFSNDNATCQEKLPFGTSCNNNGQCKNTTECIKQSGDSMVCGCSGDYFSYDSVTCLLKLSNGEHCNGTGQCKNNIECLGNMCGCNSNNYFNNSICLPKLPFGTSCNNNGQCKNTTECIKQSGDSMVCGCSGDYFSYDSVTCLLKLSYGEHCNGTGQCKNNIECLGNMCGCNSNNYFNNSICLPKPNHQEPCNASITNVCLNTATKCIPRVTSGSYCLCDNSSFWFASNETCLSTSELKVKNVILSTADHSVNVTWSQVPYGNVNYRITTSSSSSVQNTKKTAITIDNLLGGTDYTFTITTILPGDNISYNDRTDDYQFSNKTQKVLYGGSCQESMECEEQTVCIADKNTVKRCLCDSFQYRTSSGLCSSIATVKPNSTIVSTETITFTWPAINPDNKNITYVIAANNEETTSDTTNGIVSGLEPGSYYNITFITKVPGDLYYAPKYDHSTIWLWTKPAKPGELMVTKQENANIYSGSFTPSKGNVSSYTVIIKDGNGEVESLKNSTNSFYFNNLTAAQNYFYELFATNGNGSNSESTNGSFSTDATKPGPVKDFSVIDDSITANTATAKWLKPENSNGNIVGYIAYLNHNGSCVAVYTVNCSDCPQFGNFSIPMECQENPLKSYSSSEDLEKKNFNITISLTNLDPYVNYSLKVFAVNVAGQGITPADSYFRTKPGTPNQVIINEIKRYRESNESVGLQVTWSPGKFTGPTHYSICLEEKINLSNEGENTCQNTTGYSNSSYDFKNLLGFWSYRVTITAFTDAGPGNSTVSGVIQTLTKRPGQAVFNLTQDAILAKKITLFISCPEVKERNGNITGYNITKKTTGLEDKVQTAKIDSCISISPINLTDIEVEKNYSVEVSVSNQDYEGKPSDPHLIYVAPRPPLNGTVKQSVKKLDTATTSGVEVSVSLQYLRDKSQGSVNSTGILVCVDTANSQCYAQKVKKRAIAEITSITWSQSKSDHFVSEYRTTAPNWDLDKPNEFKFMIGGNNSCSVGTNDLCNGPLPEASNIKLSVFACTAAGCEVSYVGISRTEATIDNVPAIVGGVVGGILGLALIAAVVVVFIWWYKRRPKRSHPSSPFWDMDSESRKREHIKEQRPIKIYEFKDHVVRLHKDSNLLFQDEFEDIKKLSARFTHTSEKAKEESNRVKNRYVDILPYDHSRVKLDIQPEDDDSMDFINANFIPGYNSVREYIATQGPMHYTIPDFWRMTWEQKSKVIVMLSDLQEQGKRKVDLYWPENLNEPINYGNIIVEMTNFSQLNKYIIRNFKISRGSDTRKVTHFFLPGWWDFSANLTTEDVLEFAKLVRQEATPANSGPIIVHCSAGVGRTGTFIALDYFMQYIDKHSLMESVDIFSYVMKMRNNRPRMVQAETQYIFIFDALEEIISKKIKDEEEKMAEHTYGNGNIYANVSVKQPEESIYANSETVKDKNSYDNQAFEMDYQNMDLNQSKKDNPTTVL